MKSKGSYSRLGVQKRLLRTGNGNTSLTRNELCKILKKGPVRQREQQVQRPWGWEVPSTQGASKEAQGWMLKVREGLLWRMIMCSLKNLLGIGFLSERDRRLCDFMHHENHCAGGVENGV